MTYYLKTLLYRLGRRYPLVYHTYDEYDLYPRRVIATPQSFEHAFLCFCAGNFEYTPRTGRRVLIFTVFLIEFGSGGTGIEPEFGPVRIRIKNLTVRQEETKLGARPKSKTHSTVVHTFQDPTSVDPIRQPPINMQKAYTTVSGRERPCLLGRSLGIHKRLHTDPRRRQPTCYTRI